MATKQLQVYRCSLCGNMIEVVHASTGQLVCCGEPMDALAENDTDAALEKHVPVVEAVDGGIKVQVGSVPHPMQEDHLIEWVEVIADGKAYRQFLKPGEAPEAFFPVQAEELTVREFCNLHGLWKA